jgi:hypothetical protein
MNALLNYYSVSEILSPGKRVCEDTLSGTEGVDDKNLTENKIPQIVNGLKFLV